MQLYRYRSSNPEKLVHNSIYGLLILLLQCARKDMEQHLRQNTTEHLDLSVMEISRLQKAVSVIFK